MRIYLHMLLAALSSIIGTRANVGYLTATCQHISLVEQALGMDLLSAGCQNATAGITISTLDLNLCVGIDPASAILMWAIYGKYTNYCKGCFLKPPATLVCSCRTLQGVERSSALDLNCGIENTNGTLACAVLESVSRDSKRSKAGNR